MSLSFALLEKNTHENISSKYSVISPNLKADLIALEKKEDFGITKDEKIERFTALIMKRYYRLWFYIRGIPKIAIPMLITGCQRLLQKLYIKGCQPVSGGDSLLLSDCIICNGESTVHEGSYVFRYLDYGIIVIGVILLMIILRRGISEANLCVKVLKYRVFVRTSWYYWDHILLIAAVGLVCAGLNLLSSVFIAEKNAESAQIVCQLGPLQGKTIQLLLTDYADNLLYWIAIYIVSVLAYWPIIDFLIDLYDTPYKVFIEPEDMFRLNGEMKGDDRLFFNLSYIQKKVRLRYLLKEISILYKEINRWKPFKIETIPDDLLQVALMRLYNKGRIKPYKKKV